MLQYFFFLLVSQLDLLERKKSRGERKRVVEVDRGNGLEVDYFGEKGGRICVHTAETGSRSTHFRKSRDLGSEWQRSLPGQNVHGQRVPAWRDARLESTCGICTRPVKRGFC